MQHSRNENQIVSSSVEQILQKPSERILQNRSITRTQPVPATDAPGTLQARPDAKEKGNPPKKEDRRVRRTKKMLTQALTTLMKQKQIKDITVKELTELADINRGTFYLYYRDVFDMLEKLEDHLFHTFNGIVELPEGKSPELETVPVLLDLFAFVEENQELFSVLLSVNGDMNFLHRLNEVVREKCKKAWERSGRLLPEADFDYHYSFIIFGCAGLIREWVGRGCLESAGEMAELADEMIRAGSL